MFLFQMAQKIQPTNQAQIMELSNKNFEVSVNRKGITVVRVYRKDCKANEQHRKTLEQVIGGLPVNLTQKANFSYYSADLEKNMAELAKYSNTTVLPRVLIFKDGTLIDNTDSRNINLKKIITDNTALDLPQDENFLVTNKPVKTETYWMPNGKCYTYDDLLETYPEMADPHVFKHAFNKDPPKKKTRED